jgi:23S rRNA (pseudouridine1915-N3)-methyltransferase
MPSELRIDLKEIKTQARTGSPAESVLQQEAERIRQALPKRATVVVLDERGRDLSSEELARQLTAWRSLGDPISFIIGSADGLHADIKAAATLLMRLSSMTLPHGLARVLLAEQLYRAWSIIEKHPYHRV